MSSSVPSVLFLDFDGTVTNSQSTIYRAVCHIFEVEKLPPPSFEDYYVGLKYPFVDFYRSRGIRASEEEISSIFDHFMGVHWYDLFPDTKPFIHRAWECGCIIVFISGNSVEIIQRVLLENEIHSYVRNIIGNAYNKSLVFRGVMSCMDVSPDKVIAIGDSISDIEAARLSGIERAYGILRGPAQTPLIHQTMKQVGACAVIESLGEVWNHERGLVRA